MILVITGVPGTGKDTIAAQLEKKGFVWLSLNRIIKEKKLWNKKEKGCFVADMKGLEKTIIHEIKKSKSHVEKQNMIIEGHLACEMNIPADVCIVLRTDPKVLERRLKKRGYPKGKMDDNLLCEELDYCTQKAEENLKCHVYEVRTDKRIKSTMSDINNIISNKGKRFKAGWIDWSRYLLAKRNRI